MKYLPGVIIGLSLLAVKVCAQKTETLQRKNTIKLDLTSNWIFRNALNFTYKRVTKPNQTFNKICNLTEKNVSSPLSTIVSPGLQIKFLFVVDSRYFQSRHPQALF